MEILNPGEIFSAKLCAKLAVESEKPTFVRLDKGLFPELGSEKNIIDNCFSILKPVKKVNIISTGSMTLRAVKVSEVLGNKGNEVGVVDLFRIKTISNKLINMIIKKSETIFVIEENSESSGIGSIIGNIITTNGLSVRLKVLGLENKQLLEYGEREWLLNNAKLDTNSITTKIIEESFS
jgi:transketolase C-terminal domain/subunit